MKKIILLVIIVACCISDAKTQTIQWLDTIQYSTQNSTTGIGTDSIGNVYTAGGYGRGHLDFTSPYGVFISKYDSLGNLIWLDTTTAHAGSRGIAVDNNGNSYIAVQYSSGGGPISFGSYSFTHTTGVNDLFLVKYNNAGNVVWAKKITDASAKGIYMDKQGYVYLFGQALASTYFDSYTTSTSGNFVAKYDSGGNCLLAFSTALEMINVSCDGIGNIYVVDRSGSSSPHYLKKYNSTGVLQWSKWAGPGGLVYTDINGNCYLRGAFNGGSVTFGSTTLTNPYSSGVPQWFVAKTDTYGNYLWAFTPTDSVTFHGLYLSSSNIYLTGRTFPSTGGLYILKYDTSGVFVSQNNFMQGYTGLFLTTNNSNDIYLTASSWFDGGGTNIFITKISENSITTNITEAENSSALLVYPNPTKEIFQINYSSTEKVKLKLTVLNSSGKIIYSDHISEFQGEYKKTIDLSDKSKGVYFIEIIADKKKSVKKIVLN